MWNLLHILETAVNAVLPIVALLLLGWWLRKSGFLSGDFIKTGNKLVFQILLPSMLFVNVYNIESFSAIRWDVVVFCVSMLLVLFILGLVSIRLCTTVPERKGVILQNVFRSNFSIIGMPLAATLGGQEAEAVCAVVSAFAIPTLNILAVVALTVFSEGEKRIQVRDILGKIGKNPLIRGIFLGFVCLLLRSLQLSLFGTVRFSISGDLKFLYTILNNLKSAASPLALILLGGQFDFSAARNMFREIVTGVLWRVVLAPVIAIGAAVLISVKTDLRGLGPGEYPGLIALFGSATAVSSAVMAGQMGGDEQLAAQLVIWTSLCSVLAMFLTVCILMSTGLLVV